MILKHLMELYEILDDPKASGEKVKEYLLQVNPQADVETYPVHGEKGHTDMVRVRVPGKMENPKVEQLRPSVYWEDWEELVLDRK